jgi:carbamoyltransferase
VITLGINAAFHDSAAALVRDGELVAAAEEERFTRIKHGKRPVPFSAWELPYHAIDYCLAEAGITLAEVDHVAYSYDPTLFPGWPGRSAGIALPMEPSAAPRADAEGSPWDPLFLAYVVNAPRQLAGGAPHHLRARFAGVRHDGPFRWHFVEHHRAHEASAYLAAPFARCATLTLDGRGERAATTLGVFRDGVHRRLREIRVPHSLGLLYEDATRWLGFLHSSDEYKVMALASYGAPRFRDELRRIVRSDGRGRYTVATPDFARRFGPARGRGAPFTALHADVAASLQATLEETVLDLARWLREQTDERHLVMAGGVALNCVMNAHVRDSGLFDEVWVQPAAGDAGTALGAALLVDHEQRKGARRFRMDHVYWGPGFDDAAIEAVLARARLPYRRVADIATETAQALARNEIVGWFQGRMEFGPRALGARSILASPIDPEMQAKLNELKDREDFRPVAPAMLAEALPEYVVNPQANGGSAPFMLFTYRVRDGVRERVPAAVHVDGTARVQTVDGSANPRYRALLERFAAITGVPVLVNTSFNSRGEPIVCTPRDAIEAFYSTPIDVLAIGPFLLEKRPRAARQAPQCETRAVAP